MLASVYRHSSIFCIYACLSFIVFLVFFFCTEKNVWKKKTWNYLFSHLFVCFLIPSLLWPQSLRLTTKPYMCVIVWVCVCVGMHWSRFCLFCYCFHVDDWFVETVMTIWWFFYLLILWVVDGGIFLFDANSVLIGLTFLGIHCSFIFFKSLDILQGSSLYVWQTNEDIHLNS